MVSRKACIAVVLLLSGLLFVRLSAQVAYDRLLRAADEPQNWLTYSGSYASQRHSRLAQITPANVGTLEQKWIFQAESLEKFETTPLVVDGVMYLTQAPSDAVALDAKTGRVYWMYRYFPSLDVKPCCGSVNRGLAILGDTLFLATLDAHLVALDAKTGRPLWNTKVADSSVGYAMTLAPLVVKDKVIVGVAGAEFGIRGFVAAYDAHTGKEAWRFYVIPAPGERGHETWTSDSWEHGGGSIWVTGSYDPELNLTYWGTGNPGPDWNPAQRPGDNLYSDAVVALDPDTGRLKWFFQFTPNDSYDYDSVQVPVLVDAAWNGTPRKLMMWANRNGFFYVLDRVTGQFLAGYPFVSVNWASGLDAKGRPIPTPQLEDQPTFPGVQGGTNWYSPSYSPRTGLFYVSAWEGYGSIFVKEDQRYEAGRRFVGGRPTSPIPGGQNVPSLRRGPINVWTEAAGHGAVIAIDPRTGEKKWKFVMTDVTDSGILTTASDLLFTGGREGYFHALDARTGGVLWKTSLGGQVASGPMSYQVDGKQYVVVAAGHSLFAFALRE
jgi:alcohol dehydrogenase (cytochrome c)